MGYRVSGILKLPDGGSAQGLKVEFTAGATSQTVLAGTKYTMQIGAGGTYDITLEFGSYSVLGYVDGSYPLSMGAITVDATTTAGRSLTDLLGGTADVPAAWVTQIESWLAQSRAEADRATAQANRAQSEADRASQISGLDTVDDAIKISPFILDMARQDLERATGGRQTIIYDAAGNANAMFVLPRFRYEDLAVAAGMGVGDVTAFDFGSGSIKGEVFIAAHLASGSGAVSAPRTDPRVWVDHTAARAACATKGAGWHLMTVHEWAALHCGAWPTDTSLPETLTGAAIKLGCGWLATGWTGVRQGMSSTQGARSQGRWGRRRLTTAPLAASRIWRVMCGSGRTDSCCKTGGSNCQPTIRKRRRHGLSRMPTLMLQRRPVAA